MNILSWFKTTDKTERENIYEISSAKLKSDKNKTLKKKIPLILPGKNKRENLSLANSEKLRFQSSSQININSHHNNYSNKSINNSKNSDYFNDKDFVLQIKKIAPVKLPTDNDLDDDDLTNDQQKNIEFIKTETINKRYNRYSSYKIFRETKDTYLNIMELKNTLRKPFKEIEIFNNNEIFKKDLNSLRSSFDINNEFRKKNKCRSTSINKCKNKLDIYNIKIKRKITYSNNKKNNKNKNQNMKLNCKKRNASSEINLKLMERYLMNHEQKLDFNKNMNSSKKLLKNKNSIKSKDKKYHTKNNFKKKELNISKILNFHEPVQRKNVITTINLTEYSNLKSLKNSICSYDNSLKNFKLQRKNKNKNKTIKFVPNVSNSTHFNLQNNRQSSIGNFIFKRKIKVINFLHKKTNTSNVLNFDVKNLKSNLNNRKPKKEIFFDNPFTGSSSSANSTQRFVCNKHISRITNNIKANKFTKQFNIKKHTKTLNTMEKTGKIIINNI